MSDALLEEARGLILTEALKRVSDEDLWAIAAVAERFPDAGEELARAVAEEEPEAWRRFEELYRETGEEMARGR